MTLSLGNVPANSTLYIPFASYDSNGASVTLTGLAATDIEIYKNGSTTQRSSDAGYTLLDTDGIDFDGITGLHGFSIDLSDNTDAGFYSVGGFYWVVVSTVTIDTRTVTFIAATFRIVAAEAVSGKPKVDVDAWLGTAAATPTVAGVPEVDVTHYGGTAGTFASGRPEVNTSHVAGTAQTAGDIIADTNDIQTRLPAALVGGRIDANVGAISSDATAADNAEAFFDGTGYAGTNNVIPSVTTVTGNVNGSVGSVTGAVGSVTGAVGSVAAGGITASSIATDAIDADALATDAINEIADGLLNRDMSTGTDSGSSTVRTPRQALRVLRNKVSVPLGTVYKEDDSTSSWTFATTTDGTADPITVVDPTGP